MSGPTMQTSRPVGRSPSRRRGLVAAVLLALLASLLAGAAYTVFVRTTVGQRVDQSALVRVDGRPQATMQLAATLNELTIGVAVAVLTCCVLIALARRRFAYALAAVALVGGANVTTQLAKQLLPRPELGYGDVNSLPSGHTTVTMSLAVALLLVLPSVSRGLVVLVGSLGTTVVGVGMVVTGWHRPSDVVVAFAVCAAWAGLVGALLLLTSPSAAPPRRGHRVTAVLGAVVAVALAYAFGVRPDGTWPDLVVHGATVAGIGLVAALALSITARVLPVPR